MSIIINVLSNILTTKYFNRKYDFMVILIRLYCLFFWPFYFWYLGETEQCWNTKLNNSKQLTDGVFFFTTRRPICILATRKIWLGRSCLFVLNRVLFKTFKNMFKPKIVNRNIWLNNYFKKSIRLWFLVSKVFTNKLY